MNKKKKGKKLDYNVEYAHIYTDEKFGFEQRKSIEVLKDIIKRLKRMKKGYVLTVLIDEYNPIESTLNIKEFLAYLKKFQAKPDFVCFESKLVPYYKLLLKEMAPSLRREYVKYIIKRKKIPCSLLIGIWNLKRLGIVKSTKEELGYLVPNPHKTFVAKKIITILPKEYQEVEKKALKIIASTRFKGYLNNILNIFF